MSFFGLIIERCGGDPLRSQTETKSSVVRHPTLRGEFHFMIVKATVGQVLFSADIAIGPWTEIEIIVLVVNAFS